MLSGLKYLPTDYPATRSLIRNILEFQSLIDQRRSCTRTKNTYERWLNLAAFIFLCLRTKWKKEREIRNSEHVWRASLKRNAVVAEAKLDHEIEKSGLKENAVISDVCSRFVFPCCWWTRTSHSNVKNINSSGIAGNVHVTKLFSQMQRISECRLFSLARSIMKREFS